MPRRQKITTYLWFNGNAEDAIAFYTSVANSGRP
jgi:predicted 3-demethylubiquinone-9 3-methyltransferase (glyoxalase superfamily)